ncbi:MAG TPA: hypothetical protein VML55_11915, partial [Planctomycetaceae bacterium]|nr:hypothetical protein [Planctomycetaceae bacterium]
LYNFYTLATNVDPREVERIVAGLADGSRNPMEQKKQLARTIVAELHGEAAAGAAEEHFERTVQRRGELEEPREAISLQLEKGETWARLLVRAGFARSRREASRLIGQGAVRKAAATHVYWRRLDMPAPQGPQLGPITDPDGQAERGVLLRVGKKGYLQTNP